MWEESNELVKKNDFKSIEKKTIRIRQTISCIYLRKELKQSILIPAGLYL